MPISIKCLNIEIKRYRTRDDNYLILIIYSIKEDKHVERFN